MIVDVTTVNFTLKTNWNVNPPPVPWHQEDLHIVGPFTEEQRNTMEILDKWAADFAEKGYLSKVNWNRLP